MKFRPDDLSDPPQSAVWFDLSADGARDNFGMAVSASEARPGDPAYLLRFA
jgi:hypothetical protein